jgi:predicted nucleotidyltransferase
MMRLPEKMRRTLEKLVNELKCKVNVSGVGLFGSWSRGDATTSSDVDLFILNKNDLDYEYVERLEKSGYFVDLDFVPRKWFYGLIPPETDQKFYEMQILYDRDWLLTDTKLLMAKSYCSPERVDIRTETCLLNSDVYLSRATSAFSREDYPSAHVFAIVALESILRILAEIAMEPFSNSHFTKRMENATIRLEMPEIFQKYLEISRLNRIDDSRIRNKLTLFRAVWEEVAMAARKSLQKMTPLHFKVRANLDYYLNPAFLRGVMARTKCLVDSGEIIEAAHYLNNIFLEISENYAWLRSSDDDVKIDYTTLIRSLKSIDEKNPKNYSRIIGLLDLGNVGKAESSDAIKKTREIALKIRRNRKVLIRSTQKK